MIAPGPVDPQELVDALVARSAQAPFAGKKLRFRTSTNSEDLDGFPCAGCYESHSADPTDVADLLAAIRETYASTWSFRTFEERSFYGIDHFSVGMALLVPDPVMRVFLLHFETLPRRKEDAIPLLREASRRPR